MSQYEIFVTPRAWQEIKDLPGNMRQCIRRAIDSLADIPRPPESKALEMPAQEEPTGEAQAYELRRLRLDRWRVVYAITEANKMVDVLTIQKSPPYDYGDISELIQGI